MTKPDQFIKYIEQKDWRKLRHLITEMGTSDDAINSSAFATLENQLVAAMRHPDSAEDTDFISVAKAAFEVYQYKPSAFPLSSAGYHRLVLYLFMKDPQDLYVKILDGFSASTEYLKEQDLGPQKPKDNNPSGNN